MPIASSTGGALVLVTGANGYIATWVVQALLERGYTVRGTVRSEEKGRRLSEYFDSTPYGSKLEWVVVDDISMPGAFDEVVKGVDAIQHIASPNVSFDRPNDDPEVYITPAVEGTLGILRSALKFGSQIKRVVITSSIAAVLRIFTDPEKTVIVDESSWADEYVEIVKEQGKDAPLYAKYCASKTMAERAAWDFHEKHKDEAPWDLVAINPATVLGQCPLLDTPEGMPASLQWWYNNMCQAQSDATLRETFGYVDIQDVVVAHVEALRKEAAGGQRFILCNRTTTWQENRNLMFSLRPDLYETGILPRGNPSISSVLQYKYDTKKAEEVLGIKYTDIADTMNNTVEYLETRGHLDSEPRLEGRP